jgi:hypothetical protein
MAGPWEAYQTQAPAPSAGPWEAYAQAQPGFLDTLATAARKVYNDPSKLLDTTLGKVAKSVYSGVTFPGDVAAGKDSADNTGRVMDLAMVGSPVNPAIRAGDKMIPGVGKSFVPEKAAVPTAEELTTAGGAGFDKARNMGVEISPNSVNDFARNLKSQLEADGIYAERAPATHKVLDRLQDAPPGSYATIGNLDSARKSFGEAAKDFLNPTEQAAAWRATGGLHDFMQNIPPEGVLAGSPAAASAELKSAIGNYASGKRSNHVTGLEERADLNAAVAGSGQNVDNAIRQRFRDILVKPKEGRGYNDAELARAEEIARGSKTGNTMRALGNMLGGGGGLGTVAAASAGAGAGMAAGGPVGAVIGATTPILGYTAKAIGNALTKNKVAKLDEAVRMRSPLYEDRVANPNMLPADAEKRALIARMLMLGSQQR